MSLEFIIIILVVIYFRRALKAKLSMPEWNAKLQWLLYISIGLLVAQAVTDNARIVLHWVGMAILGWLLYTMSTNEKFKESKFLVTAILPYLGVSFISETIRLINVDFFNKWQWLVRYPADLCLYLGCWNMDRNTQTAERINKGPAESH